MILDKVYLNWIIYVPQEYILQQILVHEYVELYSKRVKN
jgi:hypothetical protein